MIKGHQKKKYNYYLGIFAEIFACFFLLSKGYLILERRYRSPLGEIDIIALKERNIVFVEVKKRKSIDEGLLSISFKQKNRIHQSSLIWLKKYPKYFSYNIRYDLFVFCNILKFRHEKNFLR